MSPTSRSASPSPLFGFAIVIAAASLFGTLGPLSRFAYDAGMEPIGFVAWRAGIGLLATAVFVRWRIARRGEHLVRRRDLDGAARRSLAVAAFMGFALNLAMFIAFDRITVALALLGFYTYPVMVAAANVALGREALDRPRSIALGLAVAGMVAVIASELDPATGLRLDAIGFGFALGAAVSQAIFVVISRSGYRAVPADQAMGVVLAVTLVCSTVAAVLTSAGSQLAFPVSHPSVLPILAFTGTFAAAIPSILFLTGIRVIGGTRAGILMLFEPVVGVALAAWLLDEGLTPLQVAGGLAILAAAVILQRSAGDASSNPSGRSRRRPSRVTSWMAARRSQPASGPEPTTRGMPGTRRSLLGSSRERAVERPDPRPDRRRPRDGPPGHARLPRAARRPRGRRRGRSTAGRRSTVVESLLPDVVVMDLLMPGMDGIAATAELKQRHPEHRGRGHHELHRGGPHHRGHGGWGQRLPAQGCRGRRPRRRDPGCPRRRGGARSRDRRDRRPAHAERSVRALPERATPPGRVSTA